MKEFSIIEKLDRWMKIYVKHCCEIIIYSIHLYRLSRDCYYQLRQLRTVARSLTATAAITLVHAFITLRLDYCSTLYTGLPACRLSCLERVMRSAARLIGKIQKFDHVTRYMLDVLHWLP